MVRMLDAKPRGQGLKMPAKAGIGFVTLTSLAASRKFIYGEYNDCTLSVGRSGSEGEG